MALESAIEIQDHYAVSSLALTRSVRCHEYDSRRFDGSEGLAMTQIAKKLSTDANIANGDFILSLPDNRHLACTEFLGGLLCTDLLPFHYIIGSRWGAKEWWTAARAADQGVLNSMGCQPRSIWKL